MQFSTLAVAALSLASAVVAAPVEKRSSGTGTYYLQNGNPGACGQYHSDDDMIVAVNSAQYNQGNCGRQIWITANGKTTTAKIADECPTCSYGSLDLSRGLFNVFASESTGVVDITWGMN